jgi:hypothetical protein
MGRPLKKPYQPPLMPPVPESIRAKKWSAPGDLSLIKCDHETKEMLERQSLEIFTLMANSGRTFADCLSALLVTGMQWGQALSRPEGEDKGKRVVDRMEV